MIMFYYTPDGTSLVYEKEGIPYLYLHHHSNGQQDYDDILRLPDLLRDYEEVKDSWYKDAFKEKLKS